MCLTVVTEKEVKEKEASRGVNGSGVSVSISIVAPVNAPSTISSTTTMDKGNLAAVNENIQGKEVHWRLTSDIMQPAGTSILYKAEIEICEIRGRYDDVSFCQAIRNLW
ncbi:hypothetical protein POM88_047789 [Heracleum sosnowskyi]|uniref:Uncharacterized protein n=1 Tax=Heracleum sosnowskyi TaxID=360622 RepID=A0AAD8GU43_9APIA|nr:hypothetical protein POM88_047789 [Heracleum sosnowskyi]